MERFWNIIHYFSYRANCKIFIFLVKANPLYYLLYKTSFGIKHYSNKGIENPAEKLINAYERPDIGVSQIYSGIWVYSLVFFILFGLGNLILSFLPRETTYNFYHFILFFCICLIHNHYFLYKDDKYLDYFKKIKKMEKKEKRKWAWITFIFILGVIIFLVCSFIVLSKTRR